MAQKEYPIKIIGAPLLKYTRRYKFTRYITLAKEIVKHEVEIVDNRFKFDINTKQILKSFYLEPFCNVVLSVPIAWDREKGTYTLIENPSLVQANSYAYFYPTEPSALTTPGWYNLRVDDKYRLFTHVGVIDQISGTLITDGDNNLYVRVAKLDKQIKREYITGSITSLSANSSWDSGSIDATYYSQIRGFIYADQDGTLNYYVSYDGNSWYLLKSQTYTAGDELGFIFDILAKYVKIEFINGSTDQSSFEIRVYGEI